MRTVRPMRPGRFVIALAALVGAVPAAATAAPRVLFTDVTAGPVRGGPGNLGVPITIYGTGFGALRGHSAVTIGGRPVARYLVWGRRNALNPNLDRIVVQPGPTVRGGRIVVTVAGRRSSQAVAFRVITGRIFAVAPTGSDTAACSLARPCATVGHVATNVLRPGDTVLVRGGVYDEGEVWIRGDQGDSGLLGAPKTIAAYPGERVVFRNAARPFIVAADDITVAGLIFENGKSLGIPDAGLPGHRRNRFVGNRFRGTIGFAAVDLHGDGHLAAGNDCRVDGSSVGTQGHCFYVSYGSGVKVRHNVAAGAPGYGIHVFDQQRSSSDFRRVIRDLLLEGNVVRGSTERSGAILAMGDEGGLGNHIRGVTIRDNTLTRNNHTGLVIGQGVSDVRVIGNRFVQNGRQGLTTAERTTGVTITGNRFVQSTNGFCRSNCDWYPLAHIGLGTGSLVTIRGNRYEPGPAVIVGGRDAAPAALSGR